VRVTSAFVGYDPPRSQGRWEFKEDYSQQVRYAWVLHRIEDRAGNYLNIDYGAEGGDHVHGLFPEAIRYTAWAIAEVGG
jgi:hypothetical protein